MRTTGGLSHFATTLEVYLGAFVHLKDPFVTKFELFRDRGQHFDFG